MAHGSGLLTGGDRQFSAPVQPAFMQVILTCLRHRSLVEDDRFAVAELLKESSMLRRYRRASRRSLAVLSATACAAGLVAGVVAAAPASAASTSVVVNEAYGGGGNSGATLKNDFIELANRSTGAVDVGSWSVQYISASPGATTTWQVTPLTGSISPGALYLIGEAAGAGGTDPLPSPAVNGSINMSGTSGTVALVAGTTALTCKTAADCAADPAIVDLVGYGAAVVNEGGAAPALTNTTSAQRSASADTDVNGADFAAAAPTPGAANEGGPTSPPGGGTEPGPLRIHDIQGAGWLSRIRASR
jgi:predicted extracellular nuclease